jgi:hypothetical protein
LRAAAPAPVENPVTPAPARSTRSLKKPGRSSRLSASGAIGANFTRNIFLETEYRCFYMDYAQNGLVYDAVQSGLSRVSA